MTTPPFTPEISVTVSPAGAHAECKCCGAEGTEADVQHVNFRWRGPLQSGGQAVGLCCSCRGLAAIALTGSL